jgi:glycosyltransferase involved in cell wall biosynthesis
MKKIAYILKGYPRLSETFIAQEIWGLEQLGFEIIIYSLRHSTSDKIHPLHQQIKAKVVYLPEYLWSEPWRVLKAWWRTKKKYKKMRKVFFKDLKNDKSFSRLRRFGQALVLAQELDDDVKHLHAHFLHTPATVTYYVSLLLDKPWSVSAHAKDIWTQKTSEIKGKLDACQWAITCTSYAAQYLNQMVPKVELIYHGIDFKRFALQPIKKMSGIIKILSVGRCVTKKGYDVLLEALAKLSHSYQWRFIHIGAGEIEINLKQLAVNLSIAEKIEWRGAQSHDEVIAAYRESDIFVLPSRIAENGDRDGLPNVLMEAVSQGLPLLSTEISGISELIMNGETGLLVAPEDVEGLAISLQKLMDEPTLRTQLVRQGQQLLQQKFNYQVGIKRIAEKFTDSILRTNEIA